MRINKMNRNKLWKAGAAAGAVCLFASCMSPKEADNRDAGPVRTIEVASRLGRLEQPKASDYFSRLEYIPLETTDSSLVGADPKFLLLAEHIVVSSNNRCLLFDRKTGRYLRSIGHVGNDPEGYRDAGCWQNNETGVLYFPGWRNELVKYTLDGKFAGKTAYAPQADAAAVTAPFFSYLNRDTLLAYYPNTVGKEKRMFLFFNDSSDSLAVIPNKEEPAPFEIGSFSVLKGGTLLQTYGVPDIAGAIVLGAQGKEQSSVAFIGLPYVWHVGTTACFKEMYNDTVYRLDGTRLVPRYIFDTGQYRSSDEKRYDAGPESEQIAIPLVREGERYLFFYFVFRKEPLAGIYDKRTGVTVLSKTDDWMENDLDGLLPVRVRQVTPAGEFVGWEQAPDILDRFDRDPDRSASLPAGASGLKRLNEDDNPVVVVMHPKE